MKSSWSGLAMAPASPAFATDSPLADHVTDLDGQRLAVGVEAAESRAAACRSRALPLARVNDCVVDEPAPHAPGLREILPVERLRP